YIFISLLPLPPRSTLFPYTTLFRSLTKATAHAIMSTLCDRHWVRRDPKDKTFSVGPALSKVAEQSLVANPFGPAARLAAIRLARSEEHTSELQSRGHLVCRLLLEKK